MPISRYLKIYPDKSRAGHVILYSTKKGSSVRLPEKLLAAALDDTLSDNNRQTLTRLGMYVDDPVLEQREMSALVKRTNSRSTLFRGTAVLNLECNLACSYCYEEGFREGQRMSASVAESLVDWVVTNHLEHGRDVEMQFYGGEPLLSLPLVHSISRQLQDEAANRGRKFSITMTTNGTLLTRAVVQQLLQYNFTKAILTLDGPKSVHDIQRPYVSGKGSFDTIVTNIKDVCDLVRIDLGGNYTQDNYRQYPLLLDYLLEEGITPEKLGLVHFSPVTPKSGAGVDISAGCISSSEPWIIAAVPYLEGEIMAKGFKTSKLTMSACVIEFDHDLVINYDGTLYKCPAFMGWSELSVGTLAEGISDYSESHRLGIWQNDECMECPYLPLCFGGCRLNPLLQTGSISGLDCRRDFFDATLETLVLQNLHKKATS
ncbi:MAG: geopeptide radical SAM maturase [Geobacteraceae bacterium]|nr:geopeptide radical SAM maturase [Geobacteraceae bacterium]